MINNGFVNFLHARVKRHFRFLIGFFLLVMWFFVTRKDGYTDTITFTRPEAIQILKESMPAFLLPVFSPDFS